MNDSKINCLEESDGRIIDTRESAKMMKVALSRKWGIQRLTFYHHIEVSPSGIPRNPSLPLNPIKMFIQITRGDIDCGDIANFKAVGELKTISDAMNWQHLIWQVHKMLWTGKHVAVFIRDYFDGRDRLMQFKGDAWISANEHRFQTKLMKMRVPLFYCNGIDDTFNRMEYWLENCDSAPKPINTYNADMNKFEIPVVMLCGIPGIGENIARLFFKKAKTMAGLSADVFEMSREDFIIDYSSVKGLKERYPGKLWDAFHEVIA